MAVVDIASIPPVTRRTDARHVALGVYDQLFHLLEALDAAGWEAQTECPEWTVSDMVGHLIGAARSNASVREMVRQHWWGFRNRAAHGGNPLDATNALQVREHADLTPSQRLSALRELAPRAVDGRLRMPGPLRAVPLPLAPSGSTPGGSPRKIRLGHLLDVIYSRDIWLHTIDIARATGQEPDSSGEVNCRVVADVVAEWAGRHREPFNLTLTGPAGGRFVQGTGGEQLELDAIEFCRALSGRVVATGLLATRVVF